MKFISVVVPTNYKCHVKSAYFVVLPGRPTPRPIPMWPTTLKCRLLLMIVTTNEPMGNTSILLHQVDACTNLFFMLFKCCKHFIQAVGRPTKV